MTPKQAAKFFVDGITRGLGKIQSKWDAYQWTEYDIERQRLQNTEWYQHAVRDGRV